MNKELKVELRKIDGVAIIELDGDVNVSGEGVMKGAYRSATEDGTRHVLFNLQNAEYINTSGIAVLIGIVMEAQKAEQKVLVYGVTPHYRKIFELVRLPMYVDMFDTEEEALASLGITGD